MPLVTCILADGSERVVGAASGRSVMEAVVRDGIPGISAECGGACACGTCHIYVDPAFVHLLAPPGALEGEMLGFVAAERRPESRLSCQIAMTAALDGLALRVPDRQS